MFSFDVDADLVGPSTLRSFYNSVASDPEIGVSGVDSMLNHDLIVDNRVQGSPANTSATSLKDWFSLVPGNGTCFTERADSSIPTCSTSSFPQRDANSISEFGENFDVNTSQGETEIQFRNTVAEINSECMFLGIFVGL